MVVLLRIIHLGLGDHTEIAHHIAQCFHRLNGFMKGQRTLGIPLQNLQLQRSLEAALRNVFIYVSILVVDVLYTVAVQIV